MSDSKRSSALRFDRILLDIPANNPPYLTIYGRILSFSIILTAILSAVFLGFRIDDAAAFFASGSAALFLIMAMAYGYSILSWRAVQIRLVHIQSSLTRQSLFSGAKLSFSIALENPMQFFMCIEAIRWDCSKHISIRGNDMPICLYRRSRAEVPFSIEAVGPGNGAIFGIALAMTDPLRLFQAEAHIENRCELTIFPAENARLRRSFSSLDTALRKTVMHHLERLQETSEMENLRPYLHGDDIRRILWRGFARHHELTVWTPKKQKNPSLLVIIDAGMHMKSASSRRPFSPPIADAIQKVKSAAKDFSEITVITYSEHQVITLMQAEPPHKAIKVLNQWLLDAMQWTPPAKFDESVPQWAEAIKKLWTQFKLYKGVDFSQNTPKGTHISIASLVRWARGDLIFEALERNDMLAVKRLQDMPYQDLLITLIRSWYREPLIHLPPKQAPLLCDDAVDLAVSCLNSSDCTALLWFSDFAETITSYTVQKLTSVLHQTHTAAFGIVMPMPTHSLNFIVKKGKLIQHSNISKLQHDIQFIY